MQTSASSKPVLRSNLRPPVLPAAVFVWVLAIGGCAPRDHSSWREDRTYVLETLDETAQRAKSNEQALAEMERRIIALEEALQRQQATIRALEATLAAQKHLPSEDRGKNGKDARDEARLAALKQRIAMLEARLADNGVSRAEAPGKEKNKRSGGNEEERKAFVNAFNALKRGDFSAASKGFSAMLARWPQGRLADQAWYWLGEASYALGRDEEAERAFARVAEHHPKSTRHAAALFKWALLLRKRGRLAQARAVLERLLREHPQAESVPRARQILKELASSGG